MLKWKNKKGKWRAVGATGRDYVIEKAGAEFVTRVEISKGTWQGFGAFDTLDGAKSTLESVDDVCIEEHIAELEERTARLNTILMEEKYSKYVGSIAPDPVLEVAVLYRSALPYEREIMESSLSVNPSWVDWLPTMINLSKNPHLDRILKEARRLSEEDKAKIRSKVDLAKD